MVCTRDPRRSCVGGGPTSNATNCTSLSSRNAHFKIILSELDYTKPIARLRAIRREDGGGEGRQCLLDLLAAQRVRELVGGVAHAMGLAATLALEIRDLGGATDLGE